MNISVKHFPMHKELQSQAIVWRKGKSNLCDGLIDAANALEFTNVCLRFC